MAKSIQVDTKTFVRFWLVILGFIMGAYLIVKAWNGLLIVFASIFLAIALQPLARRIDNIDKKTERKSLSAILAVIVVVVGFAIVLCAVSPVIIEQVSRFLSQAPSNLNSTLDNIDFSGIESTFGIPDLKAEISNSVSTISSNILGDFSNFAMTSISTIGSVVTSIIFVVVLTILFLLEGPDLMEKIWRKTSRHNPESSKVAKRIVERLANVISTYVAGQMIIAVIDGVIVTLAVTILGFIFNFNIGIAVPIGLISLILYLVPMFGPVIACLLNSVLLVLNSPWAALIFFIFYIIYAQIEGNIISPKIQSKGMALSPLVILVSITIGMYAFGLIGCIVAIPIAGCIKVLIDEYPNIKALNN